MNEVTLPPSPNWFLGTILACSKNGTIAWGARNAIVIAKPVPNKKILNYSIISNAHTDRVTSLAFSPEFGEPDQNLLISGGDEHIVRIWNLDTMSPVMAHSYTDTKQKVIGVDWSKTDPNLVCCVTTEGLLVSWNKTYNIAHQISLGKMTATVLAYCPHRSDLVAIGAKNGLVYIVNVHGDGKVKYKLRGHDSEIASLSWCPVDTNILNGTDSKDLLLASGGKDRSIFIWRAGGDGRYQIELVLPNNPLDTQIHRSKLGAATGVCWAEPKFLLTSSSWGELISWDLSISAKNKPVSKLVHACHARGLFCIANVQGEFKPENENWRSKDTSSVTVWTTAQDRQVVCCKITGTTTEMEYIIPTQGGYAYCIAACPLDTSQVAFGAGDAMLRLWNLSEPHENTFNISMLWQKIKGKVMAVSWHPEKEHWLAFGTGEGRVGLFDTNTSKPPVLYRQYHRHSVYSLGWGPEPNGKNHVLYSCGDGELVYYVSEKPSQEPKSVIKKFCTEFSWKPDYSCLAIGFEDGSISFLNRELKECSQSIHSLIKKSVQCLAWHPESTATDLSVSPLRHQLAIATNSTTIMIIDLSDLASALKEPQNQNSTGGDAPQSTVNDDKKVSHHKVIATLNGHGAKVVGLAWSPHFSGYLVSVSYDNTAQVWKTEAQELMATYTGHCSAVHCCMWSPLDPDLIITGSADFTIRVWRVSEQEVVLPVERRVRTKKNKSKAVKLANEKIGDAKTEEKTRVVTPDNVTTAAPIEFSISEQEVKEAMKKDMKKKKPKKCTYFPNMARIMNDKAELLNAVKDLIKSSKKSGTEQSDNMINSSVATTNGTASESDAAKFPSLFGSKEDVISIIDREKLVHANAGQYNTVAEMDIWSGNLKQSLLDAAKEKRLTDFLVSLAPSLSVKVWQEMCETYAAQLVLEGNRRKAVSYLLSIHKIHQAIDVFAEGKMYREAYVLAKCKLDIADPILKTLLETWAIYAANEGSFEDSVQCYIKLENYAAAAKCLGRRKDVASLEVAAELALTSGDEEFCATLAHQAVTEALLHSDYSSAEHLVETFPQVRHFQVQVEVLKEIKEVFQKSTQPGQIWDWLEGKSDYNLLEKLTTLYPNSHFCYEKLSKNINTAAPDDEDMLWLDVSRQLALAIATDVQEKQRSHIVTALGIISQYEILHPQQVADDSQSNQKCPNFLIKIMSTFDVNPPMAEGSFLVDEESTLCKSLRAYFCLGLLNWLAEEDPSELKKEGREELVMGLIEKTIADVLDQQTVKYWVRSNEVNKLETALAVAMGKSREPEDGGGDAGENIETLMERLDELRKEKQKFDEERVCAPSPILAYCKASELISNVFVEDSKSKLVDLVTNTWKKVTS